jgi:cysteine desulfurase / selenocysteine lyase
LPLTVSDIRALFPAVRRRTYLNAAAASPLPAPVATAAHALLNDTLENGDLHFMRWLDGKERIRARAAKFLGAQPQELAFVPSTSAGFSVIATLFKAHGIDEVVTLESEFPSTTIPLLHHGLTLRVVRPRPDGSYAVEDLEAACTPRTKAVALSIVQFASGFRIDLKAVAQLCKAKNLKLALNGAQALGQLPFLVTSCDADFVCAPSHKWLWAGMGLGLFYAKPEWHQSKHWPLAGWLSTRDIDRWKPFPGSTLVEDGATLVATGAQIVSQPSALETGGPNWVSLFCLDAALELHEQIGLELTRARIIRLQKTLREGLRTRGFVPNAPDAPEVGSGICVFPVRGDPKAACQALLKRDVMVTPRGPGLRVSTHVFNDDEDLHRLFEALLAAGIQPG